MRPARSPRPAAGGGTGDPVRLRLRAGTAAAVGTARTVAAVPVPAGRAAGRYRRRPRPRGGPGDRGALERAAGADYPVGEENLTWNELIRRLAVATGRPATATVRRVPAGLV